jgi:CRP-like cAMP-binding protein
LLRGPSWHKLLEIKEGPLQTVTFKAGDPIIVEGDAGDTAFFIVSGSVEVVLGEGDKAKVVGTLGEDEVFGEMCLIEPGPRSATVIALTDTDCLATTYAEFIEAIEDHPERAVGFMKTLVRRLRQMNEMMESMGADKRGLRGKIRDWQKSVEPYGNSADVVALSWTMLW